MMRALKKHRILVACAAIAALLIAAALAFHFFSQTPTTPEGYYRKLTATDKPFINGFEDELPHIIDAIGIDGTLELLALGQVREQVTQSNCHPLAHLVGHEAQARGLGADAKLLKEHGLDCQAALEHGIEAQIVIDEIDPVALKQKLIAQCTLFQSFFKNYPCYHGAGHAFYQENPANVERALSRCDTIGTPAEVDDCYRGIFSEIGNRVIGWDGETGLSIPGPRLVIEPAERPLAYCYSFDRKYEDACVSQIAKVTFSKAAYRGDVSQCLFSEYNALTQAKCVHNTMGVSARLLMETVSSYEFPDRIFTLSNALQRTAIDGVQETVVSYERDGIHREWTASCSRFSGELADYCVAQLSWRYRSS